MDFPKLIRRWKDKVGWLRPPVESKENPRGELTKLAKVKWLRRFHLRMLTMTTRW